MKTVKTIGLLYESLADAEQYATDHGQPPAHLYHYREPEELAAITAALTELGYIVRLLGPPARALATLPEWRQEVDFIFNLSVGFISRFRLALAPALAELAGLPYSGADPYGKTVSQHKPLQKLFMDKLGIPTPRWSYISNAAALEAGHGLHYPLIVKPAHEGSSIGLSAAARVTGEKELRARVRMVMAELRLPVIIEEFIAGREVKVGMVGDERSGRWHGMLEDVRPDGSELGDAFLAFGVKQAGSCGKLARDLAAPEYAALRADCDRCYDLLQPLDYATCDIRIDAGGRHYFLEINADATLHPARTLAQCAVLHGLSFRSLLAGILASAFARQNLRAPA